MSERCFVLFDDSLKDPTYAGMDSAYLALVDVPLDEDVQRLGETLEEHPNKLYSISSMLQVLQQHGLLHEVEKLDESP
jgi:hypothetical protein